MSRCVGVSVISRVTTWRLLLFDDQPPSSVVLGGLASTVAYFYIFGGYSIDWRRKGALVVLTEGACVCRLDSAVTKLVPSFGR